MSQLNPIIYDGPRDYDNPFPYEDPHFAVVLLAGTAVKHPRARVTEDAIVDI